MKQRKVSPQAEEQLERLQRSIETLYDLNIEHRAVHFLIDRGSLERLNGVEGGQREGVYLLEEGGGHRLGIFLKSHRLDALEENDSFEFMQRDRLDDFLTAVEEISHFVYLIWSMEKNRPVSQLSLELQGEIDKYLATIFHIAAQNEGRFPSEIRHQLFGEPQWEEGLEPQVRWRYEFANKLAYRYCSYLEECYLRRSDIPSLLRELRRFYRRDLQTKLHSILH